MKYRKKPVVVDAVKVTESMILKKELPKYIRLGSCSSNRKLGVVYDFRGYVTTIHGQCTKVVLNDWIIAEPDGEHYYPCKPDIFEATYEAVANEQE